MATVLAPCWTCPAAADICRCPYRPPAWPDPVPLDIDALFDVVLGEAVTAS